MKKINTILLCLFYVVLTACPAHPFSATDDPTSGETDPALVQVGKRNFWEANMAMAMVTGVVPPSGQTMTSAGTVNNDQSMQKINKAWQDVSGMMTTKNNISGCDPATQVGVFRLASAYCNRLVNDSAAWDNFVTQNFDSADISKLSRSHIAAIMLDSLQAGSKLNSEQREKSIATIVNYLSENGNAGDSVSKEMLFDVCTMILGSASTMLN